MITLRKAITDSSECVIFTNTGCVLGQCFLRGPNDKNHLLLTNHIPKLCSRPTKSIDMGQESSRA